MDTGSQRVSVCATKSWKTNKKQSARLPTSAMARPFSPILGALLLPLLLSFNASFAAQRSKVPSDARKPSLPSLATIFRVQGNVYPRGSYYVTLYIGDPPKPYFLDVDTGSDLTWLQCDAPCVSCPPGLPHPLYRPTKQKLVICKEPICSAVPSSQIQRCVRPTDQCDYQIEYADAASSLGVLVRDAITLRLSNGSLLQPRVAFGCGYDQKGSEVESPPPIDGILGLGAGESGIVFQLSALGLIRNVMGHCLSSREGGFLFFGDGLIPRAVTWTPMSHNRHNNQYSPGPATLLYGRPQNSVRDLTVVFDSGSSYTYFANRAYQPLLTSVRKDLVGKPLKESSEDGTLPVCWTGPRKFKHVREVKKFFKPLVLSFGKKAQLEMPPENYLIVTMQGNVCLGILNGTEVGLDDLSLLGDLSMQNLMVIYHSQNQQIGWAPANCDRIPNEEDEGIIGDLFQPYASNVLGSRWTSYRPMPIL